MNRIRLSSLILSLFLLSGCAGTPEETKLHQALKVIQKAANPPKSSMTENTRAELAKRIKEHGAVEGLVLELAASYGQEALPPVYSKSPGQNWCLVIKDGKDDRHVVVEGYGKNVVRPLFTEEVETMDLAEFKELLSTTPPAPEEPLQKVETPEEEEPPADQSVDAVEKWKKEHPRKQTVGEEKPVDTPATTTEASQSSETPATPTKDEPAKSSDDKGDSEPTATQTEATAESESTLK